MRLVATILMVAIILGTIVVSVLGWHADIPRQEKVSIVSYMVLTAFAAFMLLGAIQ